MRIELLTPRELARLDRAVDGKLMAATRRAFLPGADESKLSGVDVQVAKRNDGKYLIFVTGLKSSEVVAWSECHEVGAWTRFDDTVRAVVIDVHERCALEGSSRFRAVKADELAKFRLEQLLCGIGATKNVGPENGRGPSNGREPANGMGTSNRNSAR